MSGAADSIGRDGGSVIRRLLKGGLPAIASSGVVAVVPLSGVLFLDAKHYAVWALASTLSTVFVVFDFGTSALATKLAGSNSLSTKTMFHLLWISALPPAVLGVASILVWPVYARAAGLVYFPLDEAILLLALVAIGTLFRSVGVLFAAIALGRGHFGKRSAVLIAGALVQLAVTMAGLASDMGVMSLGAGIVAGGVVQAATATVLEALSPRATSQTVNAREIIWRFVKSKGAITALGLCVTQFDRWAVGLVGDPGLLATYDVATRIATMPKIALIAIAAGLVAESARVTSVDSLSELLRRSQRWNTFAVLVAGLAAGFVTFFVIDFGLDPTLTILVIVLAGLAHSANGATIATSMILTGRGRPDLELRYVVPLAVTCIAAYALGVGLQSGAVLLGVWSLSMIAWSVWFVQRSRVYVREAWDA